MKLISVDDKLPVKNRLVFAINCTQFIGIAFYDGEKWIQATTNREPAASHTITHWISLNSYGEWISIHDEIPEENQKVLCIGSLIQEDNTIITQIFAVEFYTSQQLIKNGLIKCHWEFPTNEGMSSLNDVEFWMPLPFNPLGHNSCT